VLAHGPADNLGERIDAAERFYAEREASARFQLCSDCAAGLDAALHGRGYRWDAPITLLTRVARAPEEVALPPALTIRVDASLTTEWLAVSSATNQAVTDVEHETRLLRSIDRRAAYVTLLADGDPVGIGRAVAEAGWTGVFSMATTVRARRRGVARLVLSAIAGWADAHGAPRLYLQVEQSNAAARRLYDVAGFTQLALYHYRLR
jgi:GNAT superfamily N-acetyltransferase